MDDSDDQHRPAHEPALSTTVGNKARRRFRAIRERENPVWFWLGMFGLVGWSVAVPTVAGVLLGWWLDRRYPGGVSWSLNLLFVGLAIGCWNAWHWLSREGGRHEAGKVDDAGKK